MTEQLNNNKGSCDKPLNHFSVLASGFQGKAVNPKSEFYSESDCSLEEGSRLYSGTGSQPHFSRAQGTFKETSQKQKQNKTKKLSMKSFHDLVCPGHYKVTMGHHLLLRLPKGSLKHWSLLSTSIMPGVLSLQEK